MLTRRTKAAFYAGMGPLMAMNGLIYKAFRAPRSGEIRVHLGPGKRNYVEGWINLDANAFTAKSDVWVDLRNPLPFHDEAVSAFYSHHFVEHLPDIWGHFRDVHRCLKPGGVYRVGGPNIDSAILKFLDQDHEWFGDYPDKRRSIGGRLENFIFCRNEHLTILTESYLREIMESVGFSRSEKRLPMEDSGFPGVFSDVMLTEHEDDFEVPHTLILEGKK